MINAEIGIGNQNDDLMEPAAHDESMTGLAHNGVGNGESAKLPPKDKKSQVHDEIWAKIFDKLITKDSRGLLRDLLGKHANTHYRPWAKSKDISLGALKLRYFASTDDLPFLQYLDFQILRLLTIGTWIDSHTRHVIAKKH